MASEPTDPIDDLAEVLRVALQMNDLTLWSASGAHVFNSETALQGLARSLLARGVLGPKEALNEKRHLYEQGLADA